MNLYNITTRVDVYYTYICLLLSLAFFSLVSNRILRITYLFLYFLFPL